jgi:hypothetical protein
MAYYSIFPEKDTTIYSHPLRTELNTGGDEVIELVEEQNTNSGSTYYSSRILMQFKNSEIQDVIDNKIGGSSVAMSASLELFATEHKATPATSSIYVYGLAQSWNEGSGRYLNTPSQSIGVDLGCTWINRLSPGHVVAASDKWVTSSFSSNIGTGTTGGHQFTSGGGTWYAPFEGIQNFTGGDDRDLNVNVTTIVDKWYANIASSSTYPNGIINNGFILARLDDEADAYYSGDYKFFSSDTHTIYPPKLTFKWDDSYYPSAYKPSGSIDINDDIVVVLDNNKQEFQRKSKHRFKLTTRKRYPNRVFTTSSNYLNNLIIPSSSYYSIRDAQTDEVVIPFDTKFTKLSVDNTNNDKAYFEFDMQGLQPERYYKILFRIDVDKYDSDDETILNSTSTIIDDDYYFKVVR